MNSANLVSASWHKSSYTTGGSNNACVEVAFVDSVVAVRDSKDPDGAALMLSPRSWSAFLQRLDRQ